MDPDFAQRRRFAIAAALTVILVPAAFLLNRDTDATPPPATGTVVGPVIINGEVVSEPQVAGGTAASPEPASAGSAATDAMGTTPVAYLDGTAAQSADDPATIAIPRPQPGVSGTATFSRDISSPTGCQVRDFSLIPFNTRITVTNRDNSQSVQCIANVGGAAPADDVVLNADAFLQIGDLTDAPIAVEINW